MAAVTADKWTSNGLAQNILNAAKNIGKTAAAITTSSAVNAAKNNAPTRSSGAITQATNNAASTAAKAVSSAVNRLTGGGSSSGGGSSATPTNTATQTQTYNSSGASSSGGGSSYGGGSTSSGGGGSVGGGTTRQAVSTNFDSAPVYDANAVYQRYLDNLRQQANDAYGLNMERIRQAYDSNRKTIEDTLASTRNQLQGGEAETTLGSLLNNYGNSRKNIEATRNKNISSLGEALQNGMAKAQQQYNSALQNLINYRLNAENSAENARQNLLTNYAVNLSDLATSNSSYLNMLRSLADSMGTVNLGDVEASNAYSGANVRQGIPTPGDAGNAYARYLSQAQMMRQSGASDDEIKDYLFGTVGGDTNALTQMFAQLGLA